MRGCAILPAYNEAANIAEVIRKVKALGIDVIVIDDGSSDNTSSIAKSESAVLIRHDLRRGKGATLKDGFDHVRGKGYDFIVMLDADGQHDPAEIPAFIDKATNSSAGIVVGNRMGAPEGMPLIRILTNRFMSWLISAVCGQRIPDTQCGYRLMTADAFRAVDIEARKYEVESELLIKLARRGYKIESVPIKSLYGQETSNIRPIQDTFRFIGFLIKTIFKD